MRRLCAVLLLAICALGAQAQTVTLTATPTSSGGSATPTLSWATTPAAASCTASGGWSGAKAPSGTQLGPQISATTTFSLSCLWPGDRRATLSWTPPTARTDGSPLTNLAGTRVYYGLASNALAQVAQVPNPAATTYIIEPLDPALWYFALTAYDAAGIESARTATVSKTTTADQTRSASATVTIIAAPSPPSNVTIALALPTATGIEVVDPVPVYSFTLTNTRGSAVVGFIRSGKPCACAATGPIFSYKGFAYCPVARADVIPYGQAVPTRVSAPCLTAS